MKVKYITIAASMLSLAITSHMHSAETGHNIPGNNVQTNIYTDFENALSTNTDIQNALLENLSVNQLANIVLTRKALSTAAKPKLEKQRKIKLQKQIQLFENNLKRYLKYPGIKKPAIFLSYIGDHTPIKYIFPEVFKSKYLIKTIEILDLAHNKLKKLPETITNLKKLKCLILNDNKLKELPTSIGRFENLEWLSLDGNKLKKLPASIGQLTNLKRLELSNNKLKKLPDLGNLKKLENLRLSSNNIRKLTTSIGRLKSLTKIDIRGNNLNEKGINLMNSLQDKWAIGLIKTLLGKGIIEVNFSRMGKLGDFDKRMLLNLAKYLPDRDAVSLAKTCYSFNKILRTELKKRKKNKKAAKKQY